MKKLVLIVLTFGIITNIYAIGHFHDWPDDSICGWVKQQPTNEGYLTEARKRGLSCNGLVTGANKTTKSASSDAGTKVTNKLGYPDGELREPKSYSIFSSQASYFKKLVSNGMYLSAQRLFSKYKNTYFLKKSAFGDTPYDRLIPEFRTAAKGIVSTFEPLVQKNIDDLEVAINDIEESKNVPESKWEDYQELLIDNGRLSAEYANKNKLVEFVTRNDKTFKLPLKTELFTESKRFISLLESYSSKSFKSYDFINNETFFNKYPIPLNNYLKNKIFNEHSLYILSELDKVSTDEANKIIRRYKFDTIKSKLRLKLIAQQFSKYDILNQEYFFSSYRLTLPDKNIVIDLNSTYILSQIKKASLEQTTSLIKKYKLDDPKIKLSYQLPEILLDKSFGSKDNMTLIDVADALKSLSAVQNDVQNSLPKKYQIAVLLIANENEKEPSIKASKILNSITRDIKKVSKSPYIITVQSRVTVLDKSNEVIKKVQSQYKSSSTMVANSNYSKYQREYDNAQRDLDNWNQDMRTLRQWRSDAESQYRAQANARRQQNNNSSYNCTSNSNGYGTISTNCNNTSNTGWGAMTNAMSGIGNSMGSSFANYLNSSGYNKQVNKGNMAIASAKQRVNSARSKLNNTSSQISKDTFANYSFTTRTFEVTKNIERVLFLINNSSNTYSVFTIPHQEKKTFVFANGLDKNDKKNKQNDYQNDDDIEMFITKSDSFSIDQLLEKIPKKPQIKKLAGPIEDVLQSIQYAFNEVTKKQTTQQVEEQDSSTPSEPKANESDDYIEKIKQAKSLLDSGIISQEEFDEIKQKIISNI